MVSLTPKHVQRLLLRLKVQYKTTLRLRECCKHAHLAGSECSLPFHLPTTMDTRSFFLVNATKRRYALHVMEKLYFFRSSQFGQLTLKERAFCYPCARFSSFFAGYNCKNNSLFSRYPEMTGRKPFLQHNPCYNGTSSTTIATAPKFGRVETNPPIENPGFIIALRT